MIGGGHTVTDPEPKYGLCVTGLADPRQIMSKAGARPRRPAAAHQALGTGRDHHRGQERPRPTRPHAGRGRLDAAAQRPRLPRVPLGGGSRLHRHHRLRAARPRLRDGRGRRRASIQSSAVPALDGALDYVRAKHVPGGTGRNREYLLAGGEPGSRSPHRRAVTSCASPPREHVP